MSRVTKAQNDIKNTFSNQANGNNLTFEAAVQLKIAVKPEVGCEG